MQIKIETPDFAFLGVKSGVSFAKHWFSMFIAVRTGLEPVTSCVTGRHSNQAELTHLMKYIKTSSGYCGAYGTRTRDLLRDRQAF